MNEQEKQCEKSTGDSEPLPSFQIFDEDYEGHQRPFRPLRLAEFAAFQELESLEVRLTAAYDCKPEYVFFSTRLEGSHPFFPRLISVANKDRDDILEVILRNSR